MVHMTPPLKKHSLGRISTKQGRGHAELIEITLSGMVSMVCDTSAANYIDSLREQHRHDVETINDLTEKATALLDAIVGVADTALQKELRDTIEALGKRKMIHA